MQDQRSVDVRTGCKTYDRILLWLLF